MARVLPDMKKHAAPPFFLPTVFALCVVSASSQSASSFSSSSFSSFSMGGLSPYVGSSRVSPMSFGSAGGMYAMAASGRVPSYMMPNSAMAFSSGFMPGFRSFGNGFPLSGFGSSIAGSGSMYMGGFGFPIIGASMG